MNSSAENGSIVRAAASDVLGDPWRIVRASVVLLVVPLTATVCLFGLLFVTMLVDPMHVDLLSWRTYRALTAFVAPLAMLLTLSVFALLDALFVSTLLDEGGFRAGVDRVSENPWGVALWVLAFVFTFWPLRLVVLPQWTMAWVLEALAVLDGTLGWLPVPAVARAIGFVVVLSTATLYLAPLAVVDTRPSRALRDNFRIIREVPVETAMAALFGVGAVITGFLVFGFGLLVLSFSLGLWIFGIVLLPIAIAVSVLGFVCLAVAYAFARSLVVGTYWRGLNRRSNDPGATPANAPIGPS